MSQKYNYYGIVGSNGYGMVKYWSQCSKCLKYFKAVQQKGFYTKEDAYKWIKTTFCTAYVFDDYEFKPLKDLERQELVFIRKE